LYYYPVLFYLNPALGLVKNRTCGGTDPVGQDPFPGSGGFKDKPGVSRYLPCGIGEGIGSLGDKRYRFGLVIGPDLHIPGSFGEDQFRTSSRGFYRFQFRGSPLLGDGYFKPGKDFGWGQYGTGPAVDGNGYPPFAGTALGH
jgi:hypothetical protein